jgi:hypothetical protein
MTKYLKDRYGLTENKCTLCGDGGYLGELCETCKEYKNNGNYKEKYDDCVKKTNGQHDFGNINKTLGYASYPCRNCGFLMITRPFN